MKIKKTMLLSLTLFTTTPFLIACGQANYQKQIDNSIESFDDTKDFLQKITLFDHDNFFQINFNAQESPKNFKRSILFNLEILSLEDFIRNFYKQNFIKKSEDQFNDYIKFMKNKNNPKETSPYNYYLQSTHKLLDLGQNLFTFVNNFEQGIQYLDLKIYDSNYLINPSPEELFFNLQKNTSQNREIIPTEINGDFLKIETSQISEKNQESFENDQIIDGSTLWKNDQYEANFEYKVIENNSNTLLLEQIKNQWNFKTEPFLKIYQITY